MIARQDYERHSQSETDGSGHDNTFDDIKWHNNAMAAPLGVAPQTAGGSRTPSRSLSHRYESLDALRGLASLWVVLHHSWAASTLAMASVSAVHLTPLRLLFGARPPVIFFFVLSGFVLALGFCKRQSPYYPAYLIRRICRIYLPFAVVVIISAAAGSVLSQGPVQGATSLLNDMWRDVSPEVLIRHLLMTGVLGQTNLDTPMWSLVQEMRISLVFPAVFAVVWMIGWRYAGAMAILLFLASWGALNHLGQDNAGYYAGVTLGASGWLTAFFLFPFVVGIGIAIQRERLARLMSERGKIAATLLWTTVLLTFALPSFSPGMDALYAIAAGALIVLTLNSTTAKTILTLKPMQWLGRISYSLYLIHLPLLAAMGCVLATFVPFAWIAIAAPLVSLPLATAAYAAIEIPSISLGRALGTALERRNRRTSPSTAA